MVNWRIFWGAFEFHGWVLISEKFLYVCLMCGDVQLCMKQWVQLQHPTLNIPPSQLLCASFSTSRLPLWQHERLGLVPLKTFCLRELLRGLMPQVCTRFQYPMDLTTHDFQFCRVWRSSLSAVVSYISAYDVLRLSFSVFLCVQQLCLPLLGHYDKHSWRSKFLCGDCCVTVPAGRPGTAQNWCWSRVFGEGWFIVSCCQYPNLDRFLCHNNLQRQTSKDKIM